MRVLSRHHPPCLQEQKTAHTTQKRSEDTRNKQANKQAIHIVPPRPTPAPLTASYADDDRACCAALGLSPCEEGSLLPLRVLRVLGVPPPAAKPHSSSRALGPAPAPAPAPAPTPTSSHEQGCIEGTYFGHAHVRNCIALYWFGLVWFGLSNQSQFESSTVWFQWCHIFCQRLMQAHAPRHCA